MNWQDASTAPKDGNAFLAWNGYWHVVSWCSPVLAGDEGAFLATTLRRVEPPFTHWMALPDGPARAA